MKKIYVEKDAYFDSVVLMLINAEIKKLEGINQAVVAMGTPMNLDLLKDLDMSNSKVICATPGDLIIALEGPTKKILEEAVKTVKEKLNQKNSSEQDNAYMPATLGSAVSAYPTINMVLISLPGNFAPSQVRKALNSGKHVMLFSDNISVEQEISLKRLAKKKGLLMMGPDCGTAIINGKPLCFANVVKKGPIGVVGASGTGIQEVTCCVEKFGLGVSQAIGTGGRDLKNEEIGGLMMLMGIEALKNDPKTKVITIVSKPPLETVAKKVIAALQKTGKPSVVHFIGLAGLKNIKNVTFANNLEEVAKISVALCKGENFKKSIFSLSEDKIDKIIERESRGISKKQKYIRGLFTGGTLADEAMILLNDSLGGVYSFDHIDKEYILKDPFKSTRHTIVDLGEDVFTNGRPHPMIEPGTRDDRILLEAKDPEIALMILDVVIGYGSHPDPAGAIVNSLALAKEKAKLRGGYLSIVVSITGTKGDFQDIDRQREKLESIGVVVMPSNYQASMLALKIMKKAGL